MYFFGEQKQFQSVEILWKHSFVFCFFLSAVYEKLRLLHKQTELHKSYYVSRTHTHQV